MRYADGEGMLMRNESVPTYTQASLVDGWDHMGGPNLLGQHLVEAAKIVDPKMVYAITSPHQNIHEYNFMTSLIKVDEDNVTYSDLWINENYPLWQEFLTKIKEPIVLIASDDAFNRSSLEPLNVCHYVPIPKQVVKYYESQTPDLHAKLNECLKYVDTLFFISAGPMSEAIIHYLFKRNPNNRYVDVGSSIDEIVHGKKTRPYMNENFASTTLW